MNILLIAMRYPPVPSISSVRPAKIVRFFKDKGATVTVLTACNPPIAVSKEKQNYLDLIDDQIEVIRVDYTMAKSRTTGGASNGVQRKVPGYRILLSRIKFMLFSFPDQHGAWGKKAFRKGNEIIERRKIDCIIAVAGPPSIALLAYRLSKRHQIPYYLDFKDGWLLDNGVRALVGPRIVIDVILFIWIIKQAQGISACTEQWKEKIQKINHNVEHVGFGFEMQPAQNIQRVIKDVTPRFIYGATRLERDYYSVRPLLNAVKRLPADSVPTAHFRFCGEPGALPVEYRKLVESGWVSFDGYITDGFEAIVRNSSVLIVVLNDMEVNRDKMTTKFFDALKCGIPVLGLCPEDFRLARTIRQLGIGWDCNPDNEEKICGMLIHVIRHIHEGFELNVEKDRLMEFSWDRQLEKMFRLFSQ